MLIVLLFIIELLQKFMMRERLTAIQHKRLNYGLATLGLMSILAVTFNITLHRGWWNGDFFSPLFH
jgi:hypothetical protein